MTDQKRLAALVAGPVPPPGTDTWFCQDIAARSVEALRFERIRLRLALAFDPEPATWWHRIRLEALEEALRS